MNTVSLNKKSLKNLRLFIQLVETDLLNLLHDFELDHHTNTVVYSSICLNI